MTTAQFPKQARAPRASAAAVSPVLVWASRISLLAALLVAWQRLPQSKSLREVSPVFDEYFVSSPTKVATSLQSLFVHNEFELWRNLWFTLQGVVLGGAIGLVCSVVVALLLNRSKLLSAAVTPILDMINAIPTIVIVPIIVLMFGPTLTTSALTGALSVFFFTVFNSSAGGASMPQELAWNARLLGATSADVMWLLRARYVVAWTVEVLPGAIGHALATVFAAELFSGSDGLGRLVMRAILTINGDLTFATVLILSVLGVLLSALGQGASKRYLHWWRAAR